MLLRHKKSLSIQERPSILKKLLSPRSRLLWNTLPGKFRDTFFVSLDLKIGNFQSARTKGTKGIFL